jgi:methylmalonyl-CoA/ethylmalonyl-CoA epimerase
MIKGINHVGIVVKSIDDTVTFMKEAFGAEEIKRIEFPQLKQISAVVKLGNDCFELMEPTGPDGTVGKFLETRGGGLHHISLLCDDVQKVCEEFEAKGMTVIGKMFDQPSKMAFLHPKSGKGILYELAERSSMDD